MHVRECIGTYNMYIHKHVQDNVQVVVVVYSFYWWNQ